MDIIAGRRSERMFIPLETAKTRYGEVLTKQRSGSFEAERVALHEVTVKVGVAKQVVAVAMRSRRSWIITIKKRIMKWSSPLELLKASGTHQTDFQHRARLDRRHFVAGRRHRDHEHHAGNGDRTDERDWHPTCAGREAAGHCDASFWSRPFCSRAPVDCSGVARSCDSLLVTVLRG